MDSYDIHLYGEVGLDITADSFVKELKKAGDKPINLYINSPGGGVYEGWTIGNKIASLPQNVTAIVEGYCGSIMTYIALKADKLLMNPTSRFMIHKPSAGIEGDAEEMRSGAKRLDTIQTDLVNTYQRKSKKSIDKINEWVNAETEFTAQEAIDHGFADGMAQPLKAVAKFDIPKSNMENKEEVQGLLNTILDKLNLLGKKEPKNIVVELEDGKKVFIQSEDGEVEGKPVFLANEDGTPTETPAPDGEHLLRDGRKITVEGGMVTGVTEDVTSEEDDEEMAALKAQVETLKAEKAAAEEAKATAEAKATELESKLNDTDKTVNEMKEVVSNLSKRIMGKPFTPQKVVTQPQNKFDNEPEAKADPMTKWALDMASRQGIKIKE